MTGVQIIAIWDIVLKLCVYVIRQIAVDTQQPAMVAALGSGIEMDNLSGCMHTGVSASGARDFDRPVGDDSQCFLNQRLHAHAGALSLPAIVGGAVVFNAECDAHGREYGTKFV